MATLRRALSRYSPAKRAYHSLRSVARSTACHLSPEAFVRIRHRLAWGRWPNLQEPRTFDEKLLWLNLYWRTPLKARCGDKFELRGYVEDNGLGHLLPRLYGVYLSTSEIQVDKLPQEFALKCTHGCKCNLFCRNKTAIDWIAARRMLDASLARDYSMKLGELHYRDMTPRIICEELLSDDRGGELPADFKLFCFNGVARCVMVAESREENGTARLAFYDREWRRRLPYCIAPLDAQRDIGRPGGYEEMIAAAETLSAPFPFVRVDFYSINGRARLGEMTLTPGACVSANYMTEMAQRELGDLIVLPS